MPRAQGAMAQKGQGRLGGRAKRPFKRLTRVSFETSRIADTAVLRRLCVGEVCRSGTLMLRTAAAERSGRCGGARLFAAP